MSGFVGWVDFRRDLRTQRDVVRKMTASIQHRGPDDEGLWCSEQAALGHRRLAVVDRARGQQPMVNETGQGAVVVAYAGAIDNFVALRRELEGRGRRFETRSDVEVLLQAYLCWGGDCVERLDGMFALAVWDARTRQLFLGRDRLGVKPLYYFEYAGGMLFASEPKGIMANPIFQPRLELSALPILLQPRLAYAGETPLVGLREVEPARVICFSANGLSSRRFWQLRSAPHRESFQDTARHVRALLEDIVARQLGADVPCGAMLSGGVDSSSVAALAAAALPKGAPQQSLDSFCIQFATDPEHFVATELRPEIDAPYAAKAAEFIGCRHHVFTASNADLAEVTPATRRARDLPGWGQFDASMYLLFREMRRHCTVGLTGEAADEIFGGYPYFFRPDLLRRDQFPWLGDAPKLSDCLAPDLLARISPREDERARYARLLAEVPKLEGEDPVEARMREVFYLGMAGPLAVILDRKDRMSMANSLEVRVPFCDHRLVEYLWNVPWAMKSTGGVKGLLKAAMADLLPASTLQRRKSAYPHVQNPEHDRLLIDEAKRIISDKRAPAAHMFDVPRMAGLIEEVGANRIAGRSFPGGSNPAYMLVHLVELNEWMESYKVSA